jgi:hypothetical protein
MRTMKSAPDLLGDVSKGRPKTQTPGPIFSGSGALFYAAYCSMRRQIGSAPRQSVAASYTRAVPSADLDPYVVLRRFVDLEQALAAESVLDASGIDCYLADENAIRLMISNLGGVRLYVRRSDAEVAATLLEKPGPQHS